MAEVTSTAEDTSVRIQVEELRTKEREHRGDLARHDDELGKLTLEMRRVGNHVMMLWWGFALLFVVNSVGFLSVQWR